MIIKDYSISLITMDALMMKFRKEIMVNNFNDAAKTVRQMDAVTLDLIDYVSDARYQAKK